MKKLILLVCMASLALPARAGVKCSGTPCIDSTAGFSSPVTTDPVLATGVWEFNNAANTPATFTDGFTTSALSTFDGSATFNSTARFSGSSRGFVNGEFRMDDAGNDDWTIWAAGTDVSTPRTWTFAFGDADRTLTMTGDASLNQNVLTTSTPTFVNVAISGGALTVATMAAETAAQSRTVTSSYTWSNAQVVALGASTTGDITVATLPAKTRLLNAYVIITGAAAGPAAVTVSCGDAIGGTPFINYVVASDAKAAANTVYGDAVAERGTSIDVEFYYLPSYTATTLVTCHFISTGANLDTVTGSTGRVVLTTELLP